MPVRQPVKDLWVQRRDDSVAQGQDQVTRPTSPNQPLRDRRERWFELDAVSRQRDSGCNQSAGSPRDRLLVGAIHLKDDDLVGVAKGATQLAVEARGSGEAQWLERDDQSTAPC
jgi:hypothetical protein